MDYRYCFKIENVGTFCRVPDTYNDYQRIGVLVNEKHGPLPLYGTRVDRRSSDWYYFTKTNNEHPQSLPIIRRGRNCQQYRQGCNELQDGERCHVQGYHDEIFVVSLFNNLIGMN